MARWTPEGFRGARAGNEAGWDWDTAFGGWLHDFVRLKDSRCLAAEPPAWICPEDRALLAGVAEFFARRFALPRPEWVDKPEYFLARLEVLHYCETRGIEMDDPGYMCWPPLDDAALYRKMAQTPKELLKRNVVFDARSLTVL